MDAEQLWETTMNPENRRLKQISIESIAEANKVTELLMGSEVESRRNFICENALDAVIDL